MEKYDTAGHTTDDKYNRAHALCVPITKATNTHSE